MPIPAQRDPALTIRQLTAWFSRKMPAARGLDISNLTPPQSTGFSNDTLLFDLDWREDEQPKHEGMVARIRPSGYAVFPSYDIAQQYRVMEILGKHTDVPVPKVFWLEEDERYLGAPFYAMQRIDGRIPPDNPPYHVAGWVTEVSPEERRALWLDGLEVMARIHKLDWRALGLDFLSQSEFGPPGLDQQLAYYDSYFAWARRGKDHPIADAAFSWLKQNRPREGHLGLCWGDSRIGNMIFQDGKCMAVLDWEMATLGDPEQDLAWWLFLDRHHSEGLFTPRLAGFPSREETIARYEEWTGRPVRHLGYYEIFAGFRFAVIMMRVSQMMMEYEVLPADSDMETNNIVTQLLEKLLDAKG